MVLISLVLVFLSYWYFSYRVRYRLIAFVSAFSRSMKTPNPNPDIPGRGDNKQTSVEINQSSIVSFIECANCRKILVADHAGGIHDVIAMIKIVPGGGANSRGGPIQINRVTRTKFLRRPKHYLR
jgi:hypothetical protein